MGYGFAMRSIQKPDQTVHSRVKKESSRGQPRKLQRASNPSGVPERGDNFFGPKGPIRSPRGFWRGFPCPLMVPTYHGIPLPKPLILTLRPKPGTNHGRGRGEPNTMKVTLNTPMNRWGAERNPEPFHEPQTMRAKHRPCTTEHGGTPNPNS